MSRFVFVGETAFPETFRETLVFREIYHETFHERALCVHLRSSARIPAPVRALCVDLRSSFLALSGLDYDLVLLVVITNLRLFSTVYK